MIFESNNKTISLRRMRRSGMLGPFFQRFFKGLAGRVQFDIGHDTSQRLGDRSSTGEGFGKRSNSTLNAAQITVNLFNRLGCLLNTTDEGQERLDRVDCNGCDTHDARCNAQWIAHAVSPLNVKQRDLIKENIRF